MVTLFIGGFPLEMTEMELAILVAPHGDLSSIKIVRDRAARKCKGYAFIEMTTREAADAAMGALDGLELQGRVLTVRIADEKQASPSPAFSKFRPTAAPAYRKVEPQGAQARPKRPRKSLQ